jgi:hypothetical protein
MKFIGEPNLLVRIPKPKNGEVKSLQFDENGMYETNNPITIKRLQARFEEVKENNEISLESMTEQEIRALGKEKGIDHYWNMKIENLIAKLKG